jgi:hypothetical protein
MAATTVTGGILDTALAAPRRVASNRNRRTTEGLPSEEWHEARGLLGPSAQANLNIRWVRSGAQLALWVVANARAAQGAASLGGGRNTSLCTLSSYMQRHALLPAVCAWAVMQANNARNGQFGRL